MGKIAEADAVGDCADGAIGEAPIAEHVVSALKAAVADEL
jgi:hypothetical protein